MSFPFALAGLFSAITFFVHLLVGGIYVVRPLLAVKGLSPASRWLNYYCWHIVTLYLAAMATVFGLAAMRMIHADAVILIVILDFLFAFLCVAVAIRGGVSPWRFPASWLFLVVALSGLWGLLG
jgi:hypothetical protein